jgi:hypothetical protein
VSTSVRAGLSFAEDVECSAVRSRGRLPAQEVGLWLPRTPSLCALERAASQWEHLVVRMHHCQQRNDHRIVVTTLAF